MSPQPLIRSGLARHVCAERESGPASPRAALEQASQYLCKNRARNSGVVTASWSSTGSNASDSPSPASTAYLPRRHGKNCCSVFSIGSNSSCAACTQAHVRGRRDQVSAVARMSRPARRPWRGSRAFASAWRRPRIAGYTHHRRHSKRLVSFFHRVSFVDCKVQLVVRSCFRCQPSPQRSVGKLRCDGGPAPRRPRGGAQR